MRTLQSEIIRGALRCPICRKPMAVEVGRSLICTGERRHCFDFSASGYVNLSLPNQSGGGDSKQAVRARSRFLDQQHYRPISLAVCEMLREVLGDRNSLVVDAGCGEGYYSDRIAAEGYAVVGVDLSKFAVDAASKRANAAGRENAFYAVSSVYELPFADGSVQAVTNLFAPCVESEYSRVLENGGFLLIAQAGEDHLMGLKRILYKETKQNGERADLPQTMKKYKERRVRYTVLVEGREAIADLFAMTPYYWRTSPEDAQKLSSLDKLETEVDVLLTVYQKAQGEDAV